MEKGLIRMVNIAKWLYHSLIGLETMFLLFKEQRQKEIEKEFLGQSCDAL